MALGVGMAVASAPAIAHAAPSDSSSSPGQSSKGQSAASTSSKKTPKSSARSRLNAQSASSPKRARKFSGKPQSNVLQKPSSRSSWKPLTISAESAEGSALPGAGGGDAMEHGRNTLTNKLIGRRDHPSSAGASLDSAFLPEAAVSQQYESSQRLARLNATESQRESTRHQDRARTVSALGSSDDAINATADDARSEVPGMQRFRTSSVAEPAGIAAMSSLDDSHSTIAPAATAARTAPASAIVKPRPTVASVVSDVVAAAMRPLMNPGNGAPIQTGVVWAALSALRDEMERAQYRRAANTTPQQIASAPADPAPNVLVIAVDGTNLSKILADEDNDNFYELMDGGTTAASSIAGHTTFSNPSWTAILTGAWDDKTGVVNNVFTPWTYDTYPTVFNQLETLNPDIKTTAIADWDVIAGIAGAGSIPADEIVYVDQIEGDADWSQTDDAVGAATVAAIQSADPDTGNFVFTYFVGVDENGHAHGGDSAEYADAVTNVDDNIGDIMAAVDAWEQAHPGEEWTVIVVTDHGHQPQQGLGHGFQSPDETSTFVIANGPGFNDGYVNSQYEIVDVTPTVVTLFGGTPAAHSDGVSLTTLGASDVDPVDLRQALNDAIDSYGYPDIATNVALTLRGFVPAVPYAVFEVTNRLTAELQTIAAQDIALISPLAELTTVAVQFVGDSLYVVTNIPAQVVAGLTGVSGASIFPLLPPEPPFTHTPQPAVASGYTGDDCLQGNECSA